MPSEAKMLAVDAGHATCAKFACAKSTCVNSAKAGDVAAAKAADVATAHTAHAADVATAKTAATKAAAMATTATAAASGLCARGEQTSGEQCACKNHHRSSFHDILHFMTFSIQMAAFRHFALSDIGPSQGSERRRCDRLEM
jgi:hypothetical protein